MDVFLRTTEDRRGKEDSVTSSEWWDGLDREDVDPPPPSVVLRDIRRRFFWDRR